MERFIGGSVEFMESKLATFGIFDELCFAVIMLFAALKLHLHILIDAAIVETAFISGFESSQIFLRLFCTCKNHELCIFFPI
jgi:hypothetical protein